MLKIIKKIMNLFSIKRQEMYAQSYHLPAILPKPFSLPQTRWPHFLFNRYNHRVKAQQKVFKDFNYAAFLDAYQQMSLFHHHKQEAHGTDILIWIRTQEREVAKLKTAMEIYSQSNNKKSVFSQKVVSYLSALENLISVQRRFARTALYLEQGVRTQLQEVESSLMKLFSYLDDDAIKSLPKRLNNISNHFSLIECEIKHHPEFRSWYTKLLFTLDLLKKVVEGDGHFSYADVRQILRPWFSNFSESELFLEQCVRQLLVHFVVPRIKTVSDSGLTFIRQFHPYWAEAIANRLESETLRMHLLDKNKSMTCSKLPMGEKRSFSKLCFWKNTSCSKDVIQNNSPSISALASDEFENSAIVLH